MGLQSLNGGKVNQYLNLLQQYQMRKQEQKTNCSESQIYQQYPGFVDRPSTTKNQSIQFSIINKLLNKLYRNQKSVPSYIIHQISVYTFNNPLRINRALLFPFQKNVLYEGNFILNKISEFPNLIRMEVKKLWVSIGYRNLELNKIMRLSVHFYQCLDSKKNKFVFNEQTSEDRWKIVSENNHFFSQLLSQIYRYREKRLVNEQIIEAFNQLMNCNIALVVVRDNEKYLIIERQKEIMQSWVIGERDKIEVKFRKQVNKNKEWLGIVVGNYQVYYSEYEIKRRNKIKILDPFTQEQFQLQDIFIS